MSLRIGQGFDAHRFREGGRLVLGGVAIPFHLGLQAHSDGDCLLHAIADALLGAIAAGDLGRHFPDTDSRYAGIDSRELLRNVAGLLRARSWQALNVDATVIAQRPRLAAFLPQMVANVADDLGVETGQVSIKATTTEAMGFTGREEGLAALAVALVSRCET
ncbi:MAG: 2-C-methyl-D-erythritol 2,4-cyclodiphosphate synthase [Nitrococcus sp.]|nr:2-C-methyl-D-erythritol 2,4-cyclodiphosphate synthase [Nitrococcus sp.]